jgi:hypothetical protein
MKPLVHQRELGARLVACTFIAGIVALVSAANLDHAGGRRSSSAAFSADTRASQLGHEFEHLAQSIKVSELLREYALCSAIKLVLLQHLQHALCSIGNDARVAKAVAAIESAIGK